MKSVKIGLLLIVPALLLATFLVLDTGALPYKVYVIHTGSMAPTIPSGSAVLVHEGHYQVGQVITFTEDGLTVTHRLVSISAKGLTTTKGDGNRSDDPWHVPKSQIIGEVVVAPKYAGYWIMYLTKPLGLASVLLAIIALWQIWALGDAKEPDAANVAPEGNDLDSPQPTEVPRDSLDPPDSIDPPDPFDEPDPVLDDAPGNLVLVTTSSEQLAESSYARTTQSSPQLSANEERNRARNAKLFGTAKASAQR